VTYTYEAFSPLEQNLERIVPLIIHNEDSKEKYQDYVGTELLKYQNFTKKDTKRLIVAFHSMMVVVYRMTPPGGKACEWVKEHCIKKLTRYVECPNGLCFWVCMALAEDTRKTAVTGAKQGEDNLRNLKRIHDHSLCKRAREIASSCGMSTRTGVGLEEIKEIAEKTKVNVYVYEAEKKEKTWEYTLMTDLIDARVEKAERDVHVLYLHKDTDAHYLYVSDPDKLTNNKICSKCMRQWFDTRKKNWQREFKTHEMRCTGEKIIKNCARQNVQTFRATSVGQPPLPVLSGTRCQVSVHIRLFDVRF
jgi:hypothetical protein